jgi:hypothetical protein
MRRAVFTSAVLAILAAASFPLFAQTDSDDVRQTVDGTIDIQKTAQEGQDAWAKEKAELVLRLRTARANVNYLTERKEFEERKAQALSGSIAELERRLEESSRLQASLQDTLSALLLRLEDWVAADLPFLMEEREARVAMLREEIVNPETIGAEKLRRILESLMIETNYGSTVEVTQDEIRLGDEDLFVDVLRLGRISLFWRTTDGERAGEYDRAGARWVELPSRYKRPIGEAMEMATRIRPVEVISLPLGRIEP